MHRLFSSSRTRALKFAQLTAASGLVTSGLVAFNLSKAKAESDEKRSSSGTYPPMEVTGVMLQALKEDAAAGKNLRLKSVQIVHRHGARTTIAPFAGQSEQDFAKTWEGWCSDCEGNTKPCEMGELTNLGKWQLYHVGKMLRKRYIDQAHLLKEQFDPSDFVLRSTNIPRTVMSLQWLMHGLYPHTSINQINPYINVRPSKVENMYPNHPTCPRLREIMHHTRHHPQFVDYFKRPHMQSAAKSVSALTGIAESNLPSWIVVSDFPRCLVPHGLAPVPALNQQDMKAAHGAADFTLHSLVHGLESSKLTIGRLLGEFEQRIEESIADTSNKGPRCLVYSGHDVTLFPLLRALEMTDGSWPGFGAVLAVELLEECREEKCEQQHDVKEPRESVPLSPSLAKQAPVLCGPHATGLDDEDISDVNQVTPALHPAHSFIQRRIEAGAHAMPHFEQPPAIDHETVGQLIRSKLSVLEDKPDEMERMGDRVSQPGLEPVAPGAVSTEFCDVDDAPATPAPVPTVELASHPFSRHYVRFVYNDKVLGCVPYSVLKSHWTPLIPSSAEEYERECAPKHSPAHLVPSFQW